MGLIFLTPVPGYCLVFGHNLKLILCVFHDLAKQLVMPEDSESALVWAKSHDPGNRAEDLTAPLLISQGHALSFLSLPCPYTSRNCPSMIVMGWGELLTKLCFFSFFFKCHELFSESLYFRSPGKMQQRKKGMDKKQSYPRGTLGREKYMKHLKYIFDI